MLSRTNVSNEEIIIDIKINTSEITNNIGEVNKSVNLQKHFYETLHLIVTN